MTRRGQTTSFQERIEIVERAAAGQSDTQIARDLGWSLQTVRKWRRRYRDEGREGLVSHMGRPASGVLGTHAPEMKEAIRTVRQAHPGWGPETLRIELQRQAEYTGLLLPSRARIAAFLQAEHLTRRYQRHATLPQSPSEVPALPHTAWQLDAQGVIKVEGVGNCCLINVLDVVSHLKIESYPCVGTRKPATEDYFLALRRAFLTWGLPDSLSLDHDTVFFDNTTPSPFPTRLHLWLVALGIQVRFIRPRRPTDHAQIERTHQTMEAQALLGQHWSSARDLWAGLDERRDVLNRVFPTTALDHQAPLTVYPDATQPRRPYRPEWEADLLLMERVYSYLAQGRWFRYNNRGTFQLGAQRYYASQGHRYDGQTLEITFDPVQLVFMCHPETSSIHIPVLPQGLTKPDLMGEAAVLLALPTYQLALPFSIEDRRHWDLITCLGDTTL